MSSFHKAYFYYKAHFVFLARIKIIVLAWYYKSVKTMTILCVLLHFLNSGGVAWTTPMFVFHLREWGYCC